MKTKILHVAIVMAVALAAIDSRAQGTTQYPTKPIRVIVSSLAGGPPDLLARHLGEGLSKSLGQPVVVENRIGAVGTIGMAAVAKASADGYTLGLLDFTHTVAPGLLSKTPYDIEKDLTPVSLFARPLHLLVVPSGSTAKSIADLVAAAKAKPGHIKYASGGNGSPAHLIGELFKREASLDIMHIPYKGPVAGANGLIAGDVDMMFGAVAAVAPWIRSGKLRALATPAPRRVAAYPELPTLIEIGYPSVAVASGVGVMAPGGTPREVIRKLHAEIAKVGALPETKQRLEALGMEPVESSPEEFAAHLRAELQRWGKVISEAKITPD